MNNENNDIIDTINTNKEAQPNNSSMSKNTDTLTTSISKDVFKRFRKHCDDECKTASRVVERLIVKYLKRGGKI